MENLGKRRVSEGEATIVVNCSRTRGRRKGLIKYGASRPGRVQIQIQSTVTPTLKTQGIETAIVVVVLRQYTD